VDAALAAAPHHITDVRYVIGSQQHFYMEPQAGPPSQQSDRLNCCAADLWPLPLTC
jgi:xanthine dehydrogenase molybdopterin-binding subunit B